MKLYRIASKPYSEWTSAISGYGAWRYGARWNSAGKWMLYTSDALTLAAWETLVHCDQRSFVHTRMVITMTVPDEAVLELHLGDLPQNWQDMPYSVSARAIGDAWLEENTSLGLRVPSVIFPDAPEKNILINPKHPDFTELLQHVSTQTFQFDPRLNVFSSQHKSTQ